MNRQTWTAEVNKMINAFAAPIAQNDAAAIIRLSDGKLRRKVTFLGG